MLLYLSVLLFIFGSGICDAKRDGLIWDYLYGDKEVFGITKANWHIWKTLGRLSVFSAFFLKGYLVGIEAISFLELGVRFACEGLLVWVVWHLVYYKTRYNEYFMSKYGDHIIFLPDFIKRRDFFIALEGKGVYIFHFLRFFVGLGGLISIEIWWY